MKQLVDEIKQHEVSIQGLRKSNSIHQKDVEKYLVAIKKDEDNLGELFNNWAYINSLSGSICANLNRISELKKIIGIKKDAILSLKSVK